MTPSQFEPARRTPPELKWLLNQRAAVLGSLERATAKAERVAETLAARELALQQMRRVHAETVQLTIERRQALGALDTTIAMVDARVRADSAGSVNAWASKYGERGQLGGFLKNTLRDGFPKAFSAATLTHLAAAHFSLKLDTRWERRAFYDSVKGRLRVMRTRDGLIEALHDVTRFGRESSFRWKAPASLDSLRAAAELSHDPPADPI